MAVRGGEHTDRKHQDGEEAPTSASAEGQNSSESLEHAQDVNNDSNKTKCKRQNSKTQTQDI